MFIEIIILLISFCILSITAVDNGLGLAPQMGWNSWNHFDCDGINQEVIKQTAKYIKDNGFLDSGYEYINLDDCWQIARNETTNEIIPDPEKFPDGMTALIDYIHSLGLKFGLYSDAGTYTCSGRPGSLGYEKIDAETYAKWGVDYLKYDNCYNEGLLPQPRYEAMAKALNETGRPIFFSMCEWGQFSPWEWAPLIGNSWRTTGDIKDNWNRFIYILRQNEQYYKYAKPGAWNDPDMLEVGNGGMTSQQYQIQFALWSLMKAPLIIGCDVTNMSHDTVKILNNTDVIAVNQDPLGKQGFKLFESSITDEKQYQLWGIPLSDNSTVIIIWNTGKQDDDFAISFETIKQGFQSVGYLCYLEKQAYIRDLINREELPRVQGEIYAIVPSEYIVMYKLTPMKPNHLRGEQIE